MLTRQLCLTEPAYLQKNPQKSILRALEPLQDITVDFGPSSNKPIRFNEILARLGIFMGIVP